MSAYEEFQRTCADEIVAQGGDSELAGASRTWFNMAHARRYSYHFEWLGRPIIQYPQDIVAMQEVIWSVKPNLVIETGIAHGGSLIFSASMLELVAACGGPTDAQVIGVDIDIRAHNRALIEAHPMAKRITMIQGSSIDPEVIRQVKEKTHSKHRVLVCLDSDHSYEHVLGELQAYAPLTSVGSYCVVFDTVIEDMPAEMFSDRPWGRGNNPKTAVREYLTTHPEFEIATAVDRKLLVSAAPGGYLKRIS